MICVWVVVCVQLRADQILQHYWEMPSCSAFGRTVFPVFRQSTHRCKDGQPIDEPQRLVVVHARMHADQRPPFVYANSWLARTYLTSVNWLTLNGQLA